MELSPLHVALALTIGHTKPDWLPVKEHIELLKKHVVNQAGTQSRPIEIDVSSDPPPGASDAINLAGYWHDMYLKSRSKWEDELERLRESLRHCPEEPTESISKRAALPNAMPEIRNTIQRAVGPNKLLTVHASRRAAHDIGMNLPGTDIELEELTLAECYYRFQNALHGGEFQEPKPAVYQYCIDLCIAARRVIISFCKEVDHWTPGSSELDTNGLYRSMVRVIAIMVNQFEVLTPAEDSEVLSEEANELSRVTIRLFGIILEKLGWCTSTLVTELESTQANRSESSTAESAAESRTSQSSSPAGPYPEVTKMKVLLVRRFQLLLNSFLGILSNRGACGVMQCGSLRESVLDGCLFLLLTRAGRLLYLLTFGQSRPGTILDELEQAKTSTHTKDGKRIKQSLEMRIGLKEADQLVPLIQHCLDYFDLIKNVPRSAAMKSAREAVSRKAKEKLQHTLLRAAFGDEYRKISKNVMKQVEVIDLEDPSPPRSKTVKLSNAEEFTKVMWEVCGWDILSKELPHEKPNPNGDLSGDAMILD